MTSDPAEAFTAARSRLLRSFARDHAALAREIEAMLRRAEAELRGAMAGTASEFERWHTHAIQAKLTRIADELGAAMGAAAAEGASAAAASGAALVTAPLEAAGLSVASALPEPDIRALLATRSFLLDRMDDVGAEMAVRLRGELTGVIAGIRTPGQAIDAVAGIVKGGRARARRIVNTELGRAFSMATQERLSHAAEIAPGLKKQWRRSGKIHSRTGHDLADGQIVAANEPFRVGGHELMYPRDPSGPASETINCGCVSLPHMDDWTVKEPGRVSFSEREQRLNPRKRDIEGAFAEQDRKVMSAFVRKDDLARAEGWLAGLRRDGFAGYDHLADGELLAIRLYSQAGPTYRRVNAALRGGTGEPAAAAYRALLDRALGRLPVHEGVVKRGTELPENVLKSLRRKRRFKEPGFLSSSTEKGFSGSVTFQITSRTGRLIAPLSEIPDEGEVLFQSGAAFDIIKKSTRRIGGKGGRPITRLVMEERHKIEDIGEAQDDAAREAERLRAWDRWCDKRYAEIEAELEEDWANIEWFEEPFTDGERHMQAKGEGMFGPGTITDPEGWPPD